jgi:hypothetical protein
MTGKRAVSAAGNVKQAYIRGRLLGVRRKRALVRPIILLGLSCQNTKKDRVS